MNVADAVAIVLAGAGAGVLNAVVGAGSLLTFPTLLLLGHPPVLANVSNTVGLVPGAVMASYGYRHTLKGRGPTVLRLLTATTSGALLGGVLLVVLPGRTFEVVVPWLLVLAAVLAALQPRIAAAIAARRAARGVPTVGEGRAGPAVLAGILVTGVYGGYFGAAQGVMLLVVLGLALGGPLNGLNGVKNVLGGTANLVSGLLFVAITEVDWTVAGLLAAGSTIGGGLGGRYGRRLPSSVLRGLLVLVALVAAAVRLAA